MPYDVPPIGFVHGQPFEIQGRFCRFIRRTRDGCAVFEEEVSGRPEVFRDEDILRLIEKGAFTVKVVAPQLRGGGRRLSVADLALDPELAAMTQRRLSWMLALERLGFTRFTEATRQEVAEDLKDPEGVPGLSTLRGWRKLWLDSGRDVASLIPRVRERGSRERRLPRALIDIIVDGLVQGWLRPEEPCVTHAYGTIQTKFDEYNATLPPELRLKKMPSLSTVYREIVRTFDHYTITLKREGRVAVNNKERPVGPGPETTRVNETWELDDTVADCMVVMEMKDKALGTTVFVPLGRPWITAVIDRHTAYCPGFDIGFEPPGIIPAFACLRVAVLPKMWVKDSYPDIQKPWVSYGAPLILHTDNLSGYKTDEFYIGCGNIGADIQHSPVMKPWYKGMIERFLGTLTRQVFRRLPGTTFGDVYKKMGKEPPESVAIVTLDELRYLVTKWLLEVYHETPHPTSGLTPRQAYEASAREHPLPPPESPQRLDEKLAIYEVQTIQRYGVQYKDLLYQSVDLMNMRIAPGASEKFIVIVNPRNLGSITVRDPLSKEQCVAYCKAAEGLTLAQHVVAQQWKKTQLARADEAHGITPEERQAQVLRAHDFLRQFADEKAGKGKKTERAPFIRHKFSGSNLPDYPQETSGDNRPVSEALFGESGVESGKPDSAEGQAAPPDDEDAVDLDALAERMGIKADKLENKAQKDG